jgi:hypothetical protein
MGSPAIILTEGTGDDAFFDVLIKKRLLGKFSIRPRAKGEPTGSGSFLKRLIGLKPLPEVQNSNAIIIVGDNDSDKTTSFKSIKEQIVSAGGYNVPTTQRIASAQGNLSMSIPLPPVSVLMLPWDDELGCLETLLLKAANPIYEKEMRCANKLADCVNVTDWDISKKSKLIFRCFMSAVCKKEPNTGLPHAWNTEKGRPGDIFLPENPVFNPIANYLAQYASSD